ncbi:hypothetical protein QAD02_013716 [Eretmocerus hayati]|uniref:Uncharacterized protein n=1 Tax=Eretmocerus hayati TaxID=131215 RepID=A0ACC2P5V5_9HYME|nr:hypothetical protein QAD02_013716 [Eretmocerus hayati]
MRYRHCKPSGVLPDADLTSCDDEESDGPSTASPSAGTHQNIAGGNQSPSTTEECDMEYVCLGGKFCNILDDYDSQYRYSDDDEDVIDHQDGKMNSLDPDKVPAPGENEGLSEDEMISDYEIGNKNDAGDHLAKKVSRSLRDVLAPWAIENNIPHASISKLLHDIRNKISELSLPLDPRTLLHTKRQTTIEKLGDGYYCHFGLVQCITKIIKKRMRRGIEDKNIDLLVNIDGAPLGASSEKNLWPILCSDRVVNEVYIIGVYAGESKPKDANEFLRKFVNEAIEVVNSGLTFNNAEYIVIIHALVCDTPAKSFILKVKGHMGYFSCTKCEIEGDHIDSVCFPGPAATPRTDEKFKNNEYQEDYQQGETVLNEIPKLGLVSGFPLDPMHLVFIGIMKKLLLILMFVTSVYKVSAKKVDEISKRLKVMKNYIPSEFARKTRALKFVHFYKATELRQFLLYSGMIALKGIVHPDVYVNFLTLHVAISILSHPSLSRDEGYLNYAQTLLKKFVAHFQKLHGAKYVSFNVHGLLHLVNDVRKYGHLENFSAFRFENFIGKLKRLIRKGNQPLQQIIRRSAEIESLQKEDSHSTSQLGVDLTNENAEEPLIRDLHGVTQYQQATLRSFKIKCDDERDNCLLIDDELIVQVDNIVKTVENEVFVIGRELEKKGELYDCPCSSTILNIHVVASQPRKDISYWNIDRVTAKMCRLPHKNQYVVIPMLHTYKENP